MAYKKSIIKILNEVADALSSTVKITNTVDNGNGTYTLTVCDMYYAQPGFNVTIGASEYVISEIDFDSGTITVSGSSEPTATEFDLYPVYFFHGTPIATGAELRQEMDAGNKTPMIWVMENLHQVFFDDPIDAREREVQSARIFFLTQANPNEWQTSDAYHNAIEPMTRLMEKFLDQIRQMPQTFKVDDMVYETENYAKFGVFISQKGMPVALFADNLSGVELQFNPLTVMKNDTCESGC